MYKQKKMSVTRIESPTREVGETIEQKVERIVSNEEPIKDAAPQIFTERKDGVIPAYNPRADKWDIAVDLMSGMAKKIGVDRAEKGKVIPMDADVAEGKTGE